jgi:hypothetical protein
MWPQTLAVFNDLSSPIPALCFRCIAAVNSCDVFNRSLQVGERGVCYTHRCSIAACRWEQDSSIAVPSQ